MNKTLGILCHVSSLYGDYGIGDFGASSKKFIDILADNNISIWQILPITKTNEYNCPYASVCSFAFDEMYVDPEDLLQQGLVDKEDLCKLKKLNKFKKVNYTLVKKSKLNLLDKAYVRAGEDLLKKANSFALKNKHIKDYAIFITMLKSNNVEDWRDLPKELLDKESKQYKKFVKDNSKEIKQQVFTQYILYTQWRSVLNYARQKGVKILGDTPIYPDKKSYDVFANTDKYKLDKETLLPYVTGGVPADDFCADGQDWGTCIYDWDKIKKENFEYMVQKVQRILEQCDIARLDHFLGLVEHYEVNSAHPELSKWVKGGGNLLFKQLEQKVDLNRIVIEDLGINKPDCLKIKNRFKLIGMRVLQFALGDNSHTPENVGTDNIYYLGTHDNNTYMGYLKELKKEDKQKLCKLLNIPVLNDKQILLKSINTLLNSSAKIVVLQIQDLLMQGKKERMNIPGQMADCWAYRVPKNFENKINNMLKLINK